MAPRQALSRRPAAGDLVSRHATTIPDRRHVPRWSTGPTGRTRSSPLVRRRAKFALPRANRAISGPTWRDFGDVAVGAAPSPAAACDHKVFEGDEAVGPGADLLVGPAQHAPAALGESPRPRSGRSSLSAAFSRGHFLATDGSAVAPPGARGCRCRARAPGGPGRSRWPRRPRSLRGSRPSCRRPRASCARAGAGAARSAPR